jgi:hypothetical protein
MNELKTCPQCGKDNPSVTDEKTWCDECLQNHIHHWNPQISGEEERIEACEECLEIRAA